MIAVMGALEGEVSRFVEEMDVADRISYNGKSVYTGCLNGLQCVVTWSGVGKVFAAAATQYIIDNYHPDSLFFTGIAGGLESSLDIGDVVIAEEVMMHDVDLSFFGFKRGELPLPASGKSGSVRSTAGIVECDKNLVSAALSWRSSGFALRHGLIITGDSFIHQGNIPDYIKHTGAMAVDMEGGASALVCREWDIPFFLARVISDTPAGTVKTGFRKFLANSSEKLYSLVLHVIKK